MDTANTHNLANLNSDVLRIPSSSPISIGQLESKLSAIFLPEDAEEWDRTGLICGNPAQLVTGIAIALDATIEAVHAAAQMGANVLLTHHPAFLDPPESFVPYTEGLYSTGSVVYEAIANQVALLNYHTALDVNERTQRVLPSMLGLSLIEVVDRIDETGRKGYGQLCAVDAKDAPLTLSQLAARCTSVFGRIPRVWGNPNDELESVVTCTGSSGSLPLLCAERSYNCLVCGEVRYHSALDAQKLGLAIIELGHDVSELPLCAVLAQTCGAVGAEEDMIRIIDQSGNWWTPETTRR